MLYNEQKPSNVCGYLAKINNTLRRCYSVQEYESIKLEEKKVNYCNVNFYINYCYVFYLLILL